MALSSSVNYWPDSTCARAFWGQQELPPYRRLLAATVQWLDPRPGERWLDLGCGSGELSRALWKRSGGQLAEVVGLDFAAVNAAVYRQRADALQPSAAGRMSFLQADFLTGLTGWADGHFDGVVSGMAIQYADSYCAERSTWTTEAYDRVLREVYRVIRPGGAFVFSVNVPEPSWLRVMGSSMKGILRTRRPVQYLLKAIQMFSYGSWLKREARRGRFHYLPRATVEDKLRSTGFAGIEHRLRYAGQAYLFRCRKP
jgi:ubiquinone/menaquinone biosynthesis C-methylase UbiE